MRTETTGVSTTPLGPAEWARRLWQLYEPIHAVVYFSPEPIAALAAAGYRGYWMGYFGGRAAPLGPVDADVVQRLFYNFSYEHVARAIPDAWDYAPPSAASAARLAGSVSALERHLAAHGTGSELEPLARAGEVLQRELAHAAPNGRELFGAYAALPWPDEPLARVWHAATLLREHRGDGHNATLANAGLGGREAIVLHAIDTGTPFEHYRVARRLDADEWDRTRAQLQARGLVDERGLTAAGRVLRAEVELQTDLAAAEAIAHTSQDERESLDAALRPLALAVVASGEIPRLSAIGIDLEQTVRS